MHHWWWGQLCIIASLMFTIPVSAGAGGQPDRATGEPRMHGTLSDTGQGRASRFSPLPTTSLTARQTLLRAMRERPTDPWPRGLGHVILAVPGTHEMLKGYHEPGGSFSPAVNSFGVSLWFTDAAGNIISTSDSVPLEQLTQRLVWSSGRLVPGIVTDTDFYRLRWDSVGIGRWQLELQLKPSLKLKPQLVIRSVGPAGGPIKALEWKGHRLLVNNRWVVTFSRSPLALTLGEEGSPGWTKAAAAQRRWEDARDGAGWGFARLDLSGATSWRVVIADQVFSPPPELHSLSTRAALEVALPESDFSAGLHAQVAHLMMGLVGRETRPGDPLNYPLNWLRDGAYVIVALARAGHLETARDLVAEFTVQDFFGGFGAEADAPGLALWALEEVAARVKQPTYDASLWPHVARKAELIVRMMTTTQPIWQPFAGRIVPQHAHRPDLQLVCEAARDGLIIGRMDHHRPLLFVNAVSYRGLLSAAAFAERTGRIADAQRWRTKAAELQQAWQRAFNTAEANNDRTYISGLWPTWIAAPVRLAYQQALAARWAAQRTDAGDFKHLPLWTYFGLAEAHQWLFTEQPERALLTLRWYWNHQASPGLYTWWEGQGEENTFGEWEKVRGWVTPPHVTPHYWTAAEMLLLQLDMLACVNEAEREPTLSIGAGIPAAWAKQPMGVSGLSTSLGLVDWQWDGRRLQIKVHRAAPVKIQLGPAFAGLTPEVKYVN